MRRLRRQHLEPELKVSHYVPCRHATCCSVGGEARWTNAVNHEGRHDGPWTYRMVQVPWKVTEAVTEAAGGLGTGDSEVANRLHST
ncbi:MAG: hypothetical protein GW911_26795 [Armatimonadetes bacterium]|nr:hypothetical protein [Armatimonadota bacterium]NCO89766.1 hypothetical protein [Armatimonadota bacterium]NCQ28585.1 hypothetical protein [Armatimonadota bacterium]NDK15655.1 hypothetical protein [Armatimonadota bacterium]PIU67331.1 MAG: hypothetical protein COS85_01080 [Armatimonadetes bacterium CG07_land_8_20_14_0_80_59_28]